MGASCGRSNRVVPIEPSKPQLKRDSSSRDRQPTNEKRRPVQIVRVAMIQPRTPSVRGQHPPGAVRGDAGQLSAAIASQTLVRTANPNGFLSSGILTVPVGLGKDPVPKPHLQEVKLADKTAALESKLNAWAAQQGDAAVSPKTDARELSNLSVASKSVTILEMLQEDNSRKSRRRRENNGRGSTDTMVGSELDSPTGSGDRSPMVRSRGGIFQTLKVSRRTIDRDRKAAVHPTVSPPLAGFVSATATTVSAMSARTEMPQTPGMVHSSPAYNAHPYFGLGTGSGNNSGIPETMNSPIMLSNDAPKQALTTGPFGYHAPSADLDTTPARVMGSEHAPHGLILVSAPDG